ncbi:MAG: peptidase S24, partial [Intestinibacter sp.]
EIVFIKRDTGKHVLHRVRKIIDDQSFIMNGDAQQWTEVVRFDQVIGVVDSFYRGDKEVSCDNIKYKTYVKLWVLCKPIRPLIFKFRNLVRKIIK